MSRTIATTSPRFRFAAASHSEAAVSEAPPSFAIKLLMLFLLLMYSSIGVLYPAVEAVRPAMTIALGAILFTIIEVSKGPSGFRMASVESIALFALLAASVMSTFDAIYLRLAVDTITNLSKIVLIYVVIVNTVLTKGRLKAIMLTLVIGGLMPAVGTIHHFMTGKLVEGTRAAWVGVFANPNEDAYSLVILVPIAAVLALRSGWFMRLALLGAIGVYLTAIYLTFSRGGLLGLLAVLGLLGWKQKSFLIKVMMIGILAGGVLVVSMFWTRKDDFSDVSQDTTFNQRIATIKAGIAMFGDKPLWGVGPGCSIVAYPLYVPKNAHCGCQDQLVIHNAFIQTLSETGALGFVPFMIFLGAALLHAWRLQKSASDDVRAYAMGLELALWGFMACGLSGGFSWTWFPYILVGLVVALKHISETAPEAT
jgi:O-antigen ligase